MLRIAMLLLVAAMSRAQAQTEPRTLMGPLGFPCGKWTNTPKNTAQHEVLKTWVFGYLSGVSVHNPGSDLLRGRDSDGLTAWIDNYCRRNPLHPLRQAAHELWDVLQAEARR